MKPDESDSEEDIDYEPGSVSAEGSQGRAASKRKRAGDDLDKQGRPANQKPAANRSGPSGSPRSFTVADPLAQLKADAKKSKINAIWEQMKGQSNGSKCATPTKTMPTTSSQVSASPKGDAQKDKKNNVPSWMLNLGLAKPASRLQTSTTNGNAPPVTGLPHITSAGSGDAATCQISEPAEASRARPADPAFCQVAEEQAQPSNDNATSVSSREEVDVEKNAPSFRDFGDPSLNSGTCQNSSAKAEIPLAEHGSGTIPGHGSGPGSGTRPGLDPWAKSPSLASDPSTSSRSVAAAALAAARAAAAGLTGGDDSKMKVVEVRDFAGQSVEVTRLVDPTSKEAQAAKRKSDMQASSAKGLDAMLAQIEKKKKLNILDKSRKDWGEYKDETGVTQELESFKKSGGTYTEKVAFLGRAELREYEKERDARLSSQSRRKM